MAYDEELADRVHDVLDQHRPVAKRMFGGLAFLVDGHMTVCVTGRGLMVRVVPETLESLASRPDVEPMQMGGRTSRTWVVVADEALVGAELTAWVDRGLAVVAELPPKPP